MPIYQAPVRTVYVPFLRTPTPQEETAMRAQGAKFVGGEGGYEIRRVAGVKVEKEVRDVPEDLAWKMQGAWVVDKGHSFLVTTETLLDPTPAGWEMVSERIIHVQLDPTLQHRIEAEAKRSGLTVSQIVSAVLLDACDKTALRMIVDRISK